jgi:hypothetical protein
MKMAIVVRCSDGVCGLGPGFTLPLLRESANGDRARPSKILVLSKRAQERPTLSASETRATGPLEIIQVVPG